MKNSLLIFSAYLFLSCNGQTSSSEPQEIQEQVTLMNDWQKDKNGCLKIRNKELAERLVTENALRSKTKKDFVKIFGEPNQTESEQEQFVLIYFFDCVCQDNEPIKGGDKCYARFYFKQDRLNLEEFICE